MKRRERAKRKRRARMATPPAEGEAFVVARAALTHNGYTKRQAEAAVDAIRDAVPQDAQAEIVLREALRALRPMCREAAMTWNGVRVVAWAISRGIRRTGSSGP